MAGKFTRNTFKSVLTMASILCALFTASAQDYVETVDTTFRLKNTLGVIITTPVSYLMNAEPNMRRAGVFYKHALRPEKWFTAGIVYDRINGREDDENGDLLDITQVTDSVIRYNQKVDFVDRTSLRFGLEWSSPHKTIAPFYGAELMLGYHRSRDKRWEEAFATDTSRTDEYVPDPARYLGEYLYRCQNTQALVLGLSFHAGWRFHIGEHITFTAQLMPELYLPVWSHTTTCEGIPFYIAKHDDAELRLRMVELGVFYRF